MRKSTFTFICLLSISLCYGQKDYLVTLKRDTLRGNIELFLPTSVQEEISINVDDNIRKFQAYEFVAFQKEDKKYIAVKLDSYYKIMRVEQEGYLKLLTYRPENNYKFGARYLLKKSGAGMEVPTFSFRKHMASFLAGCDEVVEKVENKTYKRSDLTEIVKAYNTCITSRTTELYKDIVQEDHQLSAGETLESIKKKLQSLGAAETNDFMILVADLEQKLKKGEKIPSYMISGLRAQINELQKLNVEMKNLLNSLEQ